MNQRLTVFALAACLTFGLYAVARGQNGAAAGAAAVAVVDIERVIRDSQQQAALLADNTVKTNELKAEQQQRRDEIARLRAELDTLAQGSEAWDTKAASLQQKTLELEVWSKMTQQQNERTGARQLAEVYTAVNEAVTAVAGEQGYDVVLQHGALPDLTRIGTDRLRTILQTRKVLYAGPQADITDAVLQRANTLYAGR